MSNLMQHLNDISPTGEMLPTSRMIINCVLTEGVVTGSSIWKATSEDSDIDVIIPPSSKIDFSDIIYCHNGLYLHADLEERIEHYFQDEFRSCYVLYGNRLYNLLCMHDEQHTAKWVYATKKMTERMEDNTVFRQRIKDKGYRVDCFEKFKKEYNGEVI